MPHTLPETIPLQKGILYGPVLSRRLGRSLGLNILPDDELRALGKGERSLEDIFLKAMEASNGGV